VSNGGYRPVKTLRRRIVYRRRWGIRQTSGLTVKIEKGQSNALKEIELKR
jgi:hypothetical protein